MNDRFNIRYFNKNTKEFEYLKIGTVNFNLFIDWTVYEQGQFCTGLKDKNGKLIYEGDIVKITKEDWQKDLYSLIYLVCWDRTQWQLGLLKQQRQKAQRNRRSDRQFPFKDIVSFDDYTPNKFFAQCGVIGNIYENKELLESE